MDDWLNVIKAKEAQEYRELFAQLEAGIVLSEVLLIEVAGMFNTGYI
jgi:hypothetical protein